LENQSYFNEELIALNLQEKSDEDVIDSLGKLLERRGYVKDTFIPSAIDRERVFATGLPLGKVNVAIPHTDSIHVTQQGIAVGILAEPVIFHVMGCQKNTIPVKVVFLLAIMKQDSQIDILQKLAEALQDHEFIERLCCSQSTGEVLNTLSTKFGKE